MKKHTKHFLYVIFAVSAVLSPLFGQSKKENVKLAQTGMQFLSVVSDARAAALGNGVTALSLGSASLFFNPAGLSSSPYIDVATSLNQWIADIRHNTVSASFNPEHGDYGSFGLSLQFVDYGEIIGTFVDNSRPQGYVDFSELGLANPSPTGLAIGLGYAKSLNSQFSVGGQARYVHQNLGQSVVQHDTVYSKLFDTAAQRYPDSLIHRKLVDNKKSPLVFDFGTVFKTGFKSLVIGMSIRNFSTELKYANESFELPLTFNIGLSMDMQDFIDERSVVNSFVVSVDAVHNRDYREQVFVGGECLIMNLLSLRGGYITGSDENDVTFGFGVMQSGIVFDYAYTPYGVFDSVQRLSLRFSMQ